MRRLAAASRGRPLEHTWVLGVVRLPVGRYPIRPAAEVEEERVMWRCESCEEEFDEYRLSHGRAEHVPGCDGSCRNCPVEVECGPISEVGSEEAER